MLVKAYITFDGQAEEALNFYKEVFNGKIENMIRYGEGKGDTSADQLDENTKKRIENARLDFGSNCFNVSDILPGEKFIVGNNIHLDIVFFDDKNVKETFNKLAVGAEIIEPLGEKPFSPNYGNLTDRFGINWSIMQMPKHN